MNATFEEIRNNLNGEEKELFEAACENYLSKGPDDTLYVVNRETLGYYGDKGALPLLNCPGCDQTVSDLEKQPETELVVNLMKMAVDHYKEKIPEDFVVRLTRAPVISIKKADSAAFRLFKKWFEEYYFPDDAYEGLAIDCDDAHENFWVWDKKEEVELANYMSPSGNEEEVLTVFFRKLK